MQQNTSHTYTNNFKQLDYTSNARKSGTPVWDQNVDIIVSLKSPPTEPSRRNIHKKTRQNVKNQEILSGAWFWKSYVADVAILRDLAFPI